MLTAVILERETRRNEKTQTLQVQLSFVDLFARVMVAVFVF